MFPAGLMYRIYSGFSPNWEGLAMLKLKYKASKAVALQGIAKERDEISGAEDAKGKLKSLGELKKWQYVLQNLRDNIKEYFSEGAKRQDLERQDLESIEAALHDEGESRVSSAQDVGPGVLPITTQDNLTASLLAAVQEKHALYQEQQAKTGFYKTKMGQFFQGQVQAITEQLAALKKSKLMGKIFSIVQVVVQVISTILGPITFGISTIVGIIVNLILSGVEFLVQKGITGEMKQAKTKQENGEQFVRDLQRQEGVKDRRDQQRIVDKRSELQLLKEA